MGLVGGDVGGIVHDKIFPFLVSKYILFYFAIQSGSLGSHLYLHSSQGFVASVAFYVDLLCIK